MADRLREADRLVAFAREAHVDVSMRERDEEQARRRWAKLYEALNQPGTTG